MTTMLLFLGGCQREEEINTRKLGTNFKEYHYTPFFDTIHQERKSGSRNNDETIKAPTNAQYITMIKNIRSIPMKSSIIDNVFNKIPITSVFNVSLAIIFLGKDSSNYIITVQSIVNGKVDGILVYYYLAKSIAMDYYSRNELDNFVSDNNIDAELLSKILITISSVFYIETFVKRKFNQSYYNWLKNTNLRINKGSRFCYYFSYTYYSVSYLGSDSEMIGGMEEATEYYTSLPITAILWICDGVITEPEGQLADYAVGSLPFDSWLTECMQKRLTASAIKDISEILNSYNNPCEPNKIHDIINDILAIYCSEDDPESGLLGSTLMDFENSTSVLNQIKSALDGTDAIIINPTLQSQCPLVDCLIDKLINGSFGSDFLCNLMSQFQGSTGANNGHGFHVNIVPKDFSKDPNVNSHGLAYTTVINGKPVMAINTSNCNQKTDSFDIFDTFQHEMIHANIYQDLLNTGWSGTYTDFASSFHALVLQRYGPNAGKTEHEIMLKYYVNNMIQSLIDANGGIGTFSDFEGLVLKGFGQDLFQYTSFTQVDINNKISAYNNFISNKSNISTNFISCP